MCKINDLLDRVRYVEFWLSVHYYEALWLKRGNPIRDEDLSKTFKDILEKAYHRTAMLAPCMVMTFFMLPRQFAVYNLNEKNTSYMYNFIDLLIADEAGQTSTEIAAASFALAKRAVVVGDEKQMLPVRGTVRALDIAMAKDSGVIASKKEFEKLEDIGLNCSNSSIMKVASNVCAYEKHGNKGLFLSEHRRCLNEIAEYCNKLVYNGKLKPMRGGSSEKTTHFISICRLWDINRFQVKLPKEKAEADII